MGKIYEIRIEDVFLKKVERAIRRKEDIIILLLETIKLFLLGDDFKELGDKGKIILKIDKMSRLIYIIENKYFSFNFPFNIEVDEVNASIRIYDSVVGIDIDYKLISILISIFTQKVSKGCCLDDICYELNFEEKDTNINELLQIVERLCMFECGYLRYDYDEEHQDGHIHPLNHIDINYTAGSTFKIGFENRITVEHFIDILDLKTNCHYLKKI